MTNSTRRLFCNEMTGGNIGIANKLNLNFCFNRWKSLYVPSRILTEVNYLRKLVYCLGYKSQPVTYHKDHINAATGLIIGQRKKMNRKKNIINGNCKVAGIVFYVVTLRHYELNRFSTKTYWLDLVKCAICVLFM